LKGNVQVSASFLTDYQQQIYATFAIGFSRRLSEFVVTVTV